jgi:hypothetical protein
VIFILEKSKNRPAERQICLGWVQYLLKNGGFPNFQRAKRSKKYGI